MFAACNLDLTDARADLAHAAGKLYFHHSCGLIRDLLPLYRQTRMDAVHAFTTPPMGDVTIAQGRAALGDRITIIAGLGLLCGPLDDREAIRAEVQQMVDEAAPGDHLVLSVAAMIPFIVLAERRGRMKGVFLGAIALVMVAQLGLNGLAGSAVAIGAWVFVFFAGFNVLEATLPSLVSKIAPAACKGTAMGIYATSQFAGAFLGGVGGGLAHQHYGLSGVFTFGVVVCAAWLGVASGMRRPAPLAQRLLAVGPVVAGEAQALAARLLAVPGVVEAVVVAEEGVAYLKVDPARLDEGALGALGAAGA